MRLRSLALATVAIAALVLGGAAGSAVAETPTHGIAMHGAPKYGPAFHHFDYVNPDAPKGGDLRMHAIGSFDSLNPFIVKGDPARLVGVYETLMTDAADEAFSMYGLLAETIEVPPDRSWAAFTLRTEARWQDGQPVTVEDVLFSLEILKAKGAPSYRLYYADVIKAEKTGERTVRFTFRNGENREMPLIIGQLPILPRHVWEGRAFDQTTLDPPVGSGPYKVGRFEVGRHIVLERDPTYWGRDLPVNRGLNNFDRLRFDYFRDTTVALEAFKANGYDYRAENVAKLWATGYDFPAVARGDVVKEELPHQRSQGMQGFAFNLRRPLFQDPKVRWALIHAMDFEWTNKNLFFGQYTRSESFFANSELAASGLPSAEELKILEPLRGKIPEQVFTTVYKAPSSDGSGNIRDNLRTAGALLKEAGWVIKDRKLVHATTGQPFAFEFLIDDPTWERIAQPFARNLERLGIDMTLRSVDSTAYERRIEAFDYDMIVASWPQSLSPGNEQRTFWSQASADAPGTANYAGLKDPAVDALVDLVIAAPDRASLITRTRALDRVLLWQHLTVPNWHITYDRVASWSKFKHPSVIPMQGNQVMTWWTDPAKYTGSE